MEMQKMIEPVFSVLIVDDTLLYRTMAENILTADGYHVYCVESGLGAVNLLKTIKPTIILLDIEMKKMDGYETFSVIRNCAETADIPIIFITSKTKPEFELKAFQLGAADYISKPFIPEIMLKRIDRVIQLDLLQKKLEQQVRAKGDQLEKISLQAISTVAATVDAKGRYTRGHSVRVAKIAVRIAEILGWKQEKIIELKHIALLHDIGKIGISDLILNKPTKLTDEEYEIVKNHTAIGCEILKDITVIKNICDGAKWHHEWYDGNGYPDGLAGENIPLTARIIGIADAYDAMASRRSYRSSLPNQFIVSELTKYRGTQFDPDLVDIMLMLLGDGLDVKASEHPVFIAGNLASESQALLYQVYNKSVEENRKALGIDALTQVYNRRFFEFEVNHALGQGYTGIFMMLDIDNYKQVNDTYGHVVGDKLLILLAEVFRNVLSAEDYVGRMGGDEFVIFLNNSFSEDYVDTIVNEISKNFNEEKSEVDYLNICSLSIGIAVAEKSTNKISFANLYRQADIALYSAKQLGKNRHAYYHAILQEIKKITLKNIEQDILSFKKYVFAKERNQSILTPPERYELAYQIIKRILSKQKNCRVDIIILAISSDSYVDQKNIIKESKQSLKVAIHKSLRASDFDLEFGGNQFMLILANASDAVCDRVAARVIKQHRMESDEVVEGLYRKAKIIW